MDSSLAGAIPGLIPQGNQGYGGGMPMDHHQQQQQQQMNVSGLPDSAMAQQPIHSHIHALPQSQQEVPTHAPQSTRNLAGRYALADFAIQKTLGTGSFGRVHLVRSNHNGRFYAIKVSASLSAEAGLQLISCALHRSSGKSKWCE